MTRPRPRGRRSRPPPTRPRDVLAWPAAFPRSARHAPRVAVVAPRPLRHTPRMRVLLAVLGTAVVVRTWISILSALVVPRPARDPLTRGVIATVEGVYRLITGHLRAYPRRDRLLATQAATIIVLQLAIWLALLYVGFALILQAFDRIGLPHALAQAGSSLLTLGYAGSDRRTADRRRLSRRRQRTGRGRPADRLPADALQRVQPPRDGGDPAGRAGRNTGLGAGDPCPHALRVRHGRRGRGDGRVLPAVGTVGR